MGPTEAAKPTARLAITHVMRIVVALADRSAPETRRQTKRLQYAFVLQYAYSMCMYMYIYILVHHLSIFSKCEQQ